jgi:5-methylcytosine-specific restriction endonuclease McrA
MSVEREWYAGAWRTPEGVERKKASERRYRLSDAGRACQRAAQARYYKGHSEAALEAQRRYREKDGGVHNREGSRRYLARKRDATVESIPAAFITFIERASCLYCGKKGGTVDHVVPLALGGAHAPWNLVPACLSCNSSKGTKPMPEFFIARVA